MDAITLLKNDHKAVKRLFRQFEKLGDNAVKSRRELVEKMIEELSATQPSRNSSSTRPFVSPCPQPRIMSSRAWRSTTS